MKRTKQQMLWRWGCYLLGCVFLAVGLTLNTKTRLGVSPLISVPFSISSIWGWNFAACTFCLYALFVLLQFLLKGKHRDWKDLWQIPFSVLFSLLLDWLGEVLNWPLESWPTRLAALVVAILCTGIGAATMVNMKLVANPADALANTLGQSLHKSMGLAKNLLDLTCVVVTCTVSLCFGGKIIGVGIGTLAAVLGVGRVIAVFQRLCQKKMKALAGMGEEEEPFSKM